MRVCERCTLLSKDAKKKQNQCDCCCLFLSLSLSLSFSPSPPNLPASLPRSSAPSETACHPQREGAGLPSSRPSPPLRRRPAAAAPRRRGRGSGAWPLELVRCGPWCSRRHRRRRPGEGWRVDDADAGELLESGRGTGREGERTRGE